MPNNLMHPTLSQLLPLERIPNGVEAIRDALTSVFEDIYVKNLIVGKSYHGDAGFYSLTLTTYNSIGVNIPVAQDLKLVLNPTIAGTTEIPIQFDYSWLIIKYIKDFSTDSFDNSVRSVLDILFELAETTPSQLLHEAIVAFYPQTNALSSFVTDFNTSYGQNLQVANDPNLTFSENVELVSNEIEDLDLDVIQVIYDSFIDISTDDSLERLKQLLANYFDNIEENLNKVLQLNFNAIIKELSVGLQFPRKWLVPVYTGAEPVNLNEDDPLPEGYFSVLKFDVGSLSYSSKNGFEFNSMSSFSLNRSIIGKTGLLVEFYNLKVDLRTDSNIPEATADGRGLEFKGVYVQYAGITLPKKWFNSEENDEQTTARLAGYDLLIGTGGLSGTLALEAVSYINTDGQITDYYSGDFNFNYPIQAKVGDEITQIDDYTALLTYLNTPENKNHQFVYPISITKTDTTSQTFGKVADYHSYLNSLELEGPRLIKKIGGNGFAIWFKSFDITFKQNEVVASNIEGGLRIPRLKDADGNVANVEIKGHLDGNGDFLVTASEKDNFEPIKIPGVLDLTVKTLEVGKQDDDFFIGVSADIQFTNPVIDKFLNGQTISVPRLRIYSDGSFEIVGGAIEVPTNFTLDLGPVEIAITAINYGSYQQEHQGKMRKYNAFGFDGAISLNPIGVDAKGEGIKYYYTVDNNTKDENGNDLPETHPDYRPPHSYIRIQTIRVDLVIPGSASASSATAIINGYLSIGEDEYAGGISLKLPKAKIAGSAEMRLRPKYPAFIIDASLEIPTPLPLGSTGLGVYGFRGILGYRYVAEKEAIGLVSGEDTWYDYFTYPERGINLPKFRSPDATENYKFPVSLGAGVSIATYGSDDIISLRVLLLLSIPSLFLIEGKASILSERYGLDDTGEPPFFAFLAIGDNSIEAGLGADFSLPQEDGWIIDLYAEVQAGFFFKNPSAWYINIGTKQKPITARVLTVITAQSYLMLSARGIEAGAKAEFEFDKKYGPVRVRAYAYVEVGGYISFERPQIGAYFAVGGEALIDVKIISVYIGLDLILAAEAAKPFLLYGKFRLCVKIKVLFVKIKFCGQVELKWEKSRSIDRTPIAPLLQEQAEDTIKAIHMLNGEVFDLIKLNNTITNPNYIPATDDVRFDTNVIPLDSYIDIKFNKAMLPSNVVSKIGGVNNPPENYTDLIPPQKVVNGKTVRQVKHKYSIEEISIKAAVGNQWVDYHPYQALESTDDLSQLKIGQWQKSGNEYNAVRLLATSPFSYTQQGEPEWFIPEQVGVTAASLFCEGVKRAQGCSNWVKKVLNTAYVPERTFKSNSVNYTLKGDFFMDENSRLQAGSTAVVTDVSNPFNFKQSLQFNNTNYIEILLPEECANVSLLLTTYAQGVNIKYYNAVLDDQNYEVQYNLALSIHKTTEELATGAVAYNNPNVLIAKIRIEPDFGDITEIQNVLEQIRALYVKDYNLRIANGETTSDGNISPIYGEDLDILTRQLDALLSIGCSVCSIDEPRGGIGRMQIGNTFCVGDAPVTIDDCNGETRCTTLLHEVCWLNVEDYEFNQNIPEQNAIQQDFQTASDAITNVVDPVWRPNTKYYIHFKLKDDVDNGNNEGVYDYFYGFRTSGPVGHFHRDQGSSYGDITDENGAVTEGSIVTPDNYLLTSLRGYIDYKRSYPNADGNLLRSKPLFYGRGELMLFFTNPSTYHMFANWPEYQGMPALQSEMKFFVKDPVNDTIIEHPMPPDVDITNIPQTVETWTKDTEPLMPEYLQMLNNFVQEQVTNPDLNCVLTGGDLIKPASNFMTITFKNNLKPQKLYTALVNNIFEGVTREVHNYGFQTSRYLNFEEQVNSYKLTDNLGNSRDAVFEVDLDISQTDIAVAYNTIAGIDDTNSSDLEGQYLDLFDRVTEGILGFKPIDPPQTTEFNVLRNINTGDIIAILIRNPEPFNDPKIPLGEIQNTISVLNGDIQDDTFKGLFSKDLSQIIIMHESEKISVNELDFKFQYLKWDGNAYQIDSEVNVENINLLNN